MNDQQTQPAQREARSAPPTGSAISEADLIARKALAADWLQLHRENQRLQGALAEICQIDDAAGWEHGHTGKMNAMAYVARQALSPNIRI